MKPILNANMTEFISDTKLLEMNSAAIAKLRDDVPVRVTEDFVRSALLSNLQINQWGAVIKQSVVFVNLGLGIYEARLTRDGDTQLNKV